MDIQRQARAIIVDLPGTHSALSHALGHGGFSRIRSVVWAYVRREELPLDVDPLSLLRRRLAEAGRPDALGFLTSRDLAFLHRADRAGVTALATVGLSNALRVGDPPAGPPPGTINVLVRVPSPLTEGAMVEALAMTAEARTLAVREAEWPSIQTGRPASGTGTDCITVVAPQGADPEPWCGKHTALGSDIGGAVLDAVSQGAITWKAARA
ncbi:MAG: adenosylcobinamide amidohydrolase [Myxococcota bacterium]|nr:adenosylcobinamide amidohydrolase [Myxococcota bacterium]